MRRDRRRTSESQAATRGACVARRRGVLLRTHPLVVLSIVLALAGCGGRSSAHDAVEAPPLPDRGDDEEDDDLVALEHEETRAFVRSEVLALSHGVTALRAPARVAFRDGAIAELGTPVPGRVSEVHVRVGDEVAAGAPLVTLRSPDAAATRAQLAAARTALANALAEARRSADMLERGVGTERERRAADLHVAELEIELARARTAVSIVGRGAGGEVVLRAPIAGTILSRRAAIGMAVEPGGEALLEIGDPHGIGVVAEVFDRDAAMVRVGASAEIALPSIDSPLRGRVTHVAPVVSAGMRTVPVRIELESVPSLLRPGLFGRASISLVDEGLVLPASAVLVRDGQRTAVYVDEGDGRFRRRDVVVGPSIDGRVQVLAGLREGERVVVEGALLLDGAADLML